MEKIGSLILFVFLLVFQTYAEEPKVLATVNSNEVGLGETLIYRVSVDASDTENIGEPRLPDLQGFELLSRSQGMEARSEFINGKFSFIKKQVFTFQLRATHAGDRIIGRSEVVVDDKTLSTQPIRIHISNQPSSNSQTTDPVDDTSAWDEADELFNQILKRSLPTVKEIPNLNEKEAFFVRLEVDKKKVFVGEQVTATWYLYTQNSLSNFEPIKYPDLKGFWKEDIELATRLNFETEVINGIAYKKALLVSYALFPIKAGTAVIDSYKLRASAFVANVFGGLGKPYTFTKTNLPEKIEVMPLPPGQPQDFNGAVGSFKISSKLDKFKVPANEPFSLKIRVEGRGNAKQIELPTLNLPSEFETYDTKSDSKFYKDGTSFKEFEVLIIPRKEGRLSIPSVSMSFFNPTSRKYERTQTDSLAVEVGTGKNFSNENSIPLDLKNVSENAKKMELPSPALEFSSTLWNQKFSLWIYLGGFSVFMISLMFIAFRSLKVYDQKDALNKILSNYLKSIMRASKAQDYKTVGTQAINMCNSILMEMVQSKDANSYDALVEQLPPSLKKIFNEQFLGAYKYFETLGFAPLEISKKFMNKEDCDKNTKILKKALLESINSYERI